MKPMFTLRIKGQPKSELRKLRRRAQELETQLLRTPGKGGRELSRMAVYHAKKIAPVDTGALVNAIQVGQERDSKGRFTSTIESRTPRNPRPRRETKDYHVLMHEYDSVAARIKTGDPRYMYSTAAHMLRVAPRKARDLVFNLVQSF